MHSHEDGCTRRGFWRAGLTGGLAAALGASRGATAEAGPDARDRLRLKPQTDGRGPGGRAGMLAYSDGSWGAGRGLNLHTGSAWQRLNPADVTAYGAKGDGETDDTRAFDRAFAAENAVHVPAGRYVVGPARTDDARPTGEAGMIEVPSGKALILHPGAVLLNGAGKGQYSDPDGRKVDLHLLYVSGHGSAVFGNGATVDDRELPGGRHGRHGGGVVLAGDASECLITDLRVINVGPGRDNAFRVSGRRNVLSRCFAQRRTYAHLFQVVSAGQPCRDCVVEACVADGGWDEYESGQKPDFGRKIGSQDGFRTYGNVHRARFAGCTAYRCRAGFQLWGTHSHGSVIDGCSAYRNFWFGIADLSYEQGGAISGCTAEHNVSYGLYVRSDGATVSGVHLHRNYTREFDFSSPPPHLDDTGVSMSEETPVEFFLSGNRCCITGVTHGVQVGSHNR